MKIKDCNKIANKEIMIQWESELCIQGRFNGIKGKI